MKLLPLLIILLCSCAKEEQILPSCDWVHATRVDDRIHIKIYSDSPEVKATLEYRTGNVTKTFRKHFYNCISISDDADRVIFTDESDCVLVVK